MLYAKIKITSPSIHSGNIVNYIKKKSHDFKQATQHRESCTNPFSKKDGEYPSSLKPHNNNLMNKTTSKKKNLREIDNVNGEDFKILSKPSSIVINSVAWYSKKLESHPLTTKCISSAFIAGSGDLTCQYVVTQQKQRQKILKQNDQISPTVINNDRNQQSDNIMDENKFRPDLHRTGRFILLGGALIGPTVHHWYGALMKYIPGSSLGVVLKRTFLDQAFFAPLFQPTFIASLLLLERNGDSCLSLERILKAGVVRDSTEKEDDILTVVARTAPDVIISNWMLWIPAMMVNFKYVPGKWQVLYSNGVGFVWNVYLSWKTQE